MDDDTGMQIMAELRSIRRLMAAYLDYVAVSASIGIELAQVARIGGTVDQHTENLAEAARLLEERVEDYIRG